MPPSDLDVSQPVPKPRPLEEAQQLIQALWQQLAALQQRLKELEKQLATHSGNSSQPPSQDSPKQRAERLHKKPTGRRQGAQPKHERALVDVAEVDRIEHYYPHTRCVCGGEVLLDRCRRHQVFDVPAVRYTVVEHRCYEGCCTQCQTRHRAALPADVPSGQMGPGLIAWISLMNSHYHLSLRQIESLLAEQWSLRFSLCAISEAQEPLIAWLAPIYRQIAEAAQSVVLARRTRPAIFADTAAIGCGP